MSQRKGMGKGKGKGYHNIMGSDPKVHSQSAKGIKQPQKLKVTMANLTNKKQNPELPDSVYNKTLTEKEMKLIKRRLNDDKITTAEIFDKQPYFELGKDITRKGKQWLMNLWKTPKGLERKNSPYGAREEYVLENFDRIELIDFINNVNPTQMSMGLNNYQPLYRVVAKDGSSFDYYVGFQRRDQKVPINIIG